MSIALTGAILIFLTFLGYWRPNPLPFMLAAGASIMLGLHWYDVYTTDLGLTMGLMLIGYGFVCVGLVFRMIFWRDRLRDE